MELILKRMRVRALVRDAKAATAAFGPYVEVTLITDFSWLGPGLGYTVY